MVSEMFDDNIWPHTLDINALLTTGWRPSPFREYVLKLYSRCDLACDYCYMYTMADQDWRNQPFRMSIQTIESTVMRIAEHATSHKLRQIRVILHGGEPLLAGEASIRLLTERLNAALPSFTSVGISLQTNGLHLTDQNLRVLNELEIEVAVSLDGRIADHDRHRKFANGKGSHAAVLSGIERISAASYKHLFRGLLCTIDLESDPLATYDFLIALKPPVVDFILPHRNWSDTSSKTYGEQIRTPYADWLLAIFDRWYSLPQQQTSIRIFESIMSLSLGGTTLLDGLGLDPLKIIVVNTDGEILHSDFLQSAYPNAARTGFHVDTHSFDLVALSPSIAARQLGTTGLSSTCRLCRLQKICGGGQFAHRYRPGHGFDNPSVYCADLSRLIGHIYGRLKADIAEIHK